MTKATAKRRDTPVRRRRNVGQKLDLAWHQLSMDIAGIAGPIAAVIMGRSEDEPKLTSEVIAHTAVEMAMMILSRSIEVAEEVEKYKGLVPVEECE